MTQNFDWKLVLKYALKTTVMAVVCLCFCLTIFVGVFFPSAVAFFDDLKFENVAIKGYEKIYADSESFADLYNLVCACAKYEDFERLEKYSNIFRQNESDAKKDFVKKMDESSLENSEAFNFAYVASVENYVQNCALRATYKLKGFEQAKEIANQSLKTNNLFENALCFQFGTLVDCVEKDLVLTDEQKQNLYKQLFDLKIEDKSFETLLQEKCALVESEIAKRTRILTSKKDRFEKIALLSVLIEIKNVNVFVLESTMGFLTESEKQIAKEKVVTLILQIKTAKAEYNNLVKI